MVSLFNIHLEFKKLKFIIFFIKILVHVGCICSWGYISFTDQTETVRSRFGLIDVQIY